MESKIKFLRQEVNINSNTVLSLCTWEPKCIDKIMVLVHGMAEHAERYNRFANFLATSNIAVFAFDLRGHGQSITEKEQAGFFGYGVSFTDIINDITYLIDFVQNKYPKIPTILFGHSMGSFIAQGVLQQKSNKLDGCILSGTGMPKLVIAKIGKAIAKIIKNNRGENYKSKFLDNMAFSSYQKKIKNPTTTFDWLSRNKDEVQKYIADPLCGFLCSASFFYELTSLNCHIQKKKNISQIQSSLPIFFIAGTDDPVGNYNQDINKLIDTYKTLGIKNISKTYYQGGRHEMLNEINYEEVQNDILNWINKI